MHVPGYLIDGHIRLLKRARQIALALIAELRAKEQRKNRAGDHRENEGREQQFDHRKAIGDFELRAHLACFTEESYLCTELSRLTGSIGWFALAWRQPTIMRLPMTTPPVVCGITAHRNSKIAPLGPGYAGIMKFAGTEPASTEKSITAVESAITTAAPGEPSPVIVIM